MNDRLILREIEVESLIGLLPDERHGKQPLFISATLELDMRPAAEADRMEAVVDYAEVVARIREFAADFRDHTLERFADRLALRLRDLYPEVHRVGILVSKPKFTAPLGLRAVEVYVER